MRLEVDEDGVLNGSRRLPCLVDIRILCVSFHQLRLHCLLTNYYITLKLGALIMYAVI